MSATADEMERLVPSSDDWSLLRGLLLGVAVGAAIAGVLLLAQILKDRRAARRARPDQGLPPAPPPGSDPSPL